MTLRRVHFVSMLLLLAAPALRGDEERSADMRFVLQWGVQGSEPGQFHFPIGIVINPADEIFVTDHRNNRIQKFDTQGKFLAQFPVRGNPGGLGLAPTGELYLGHFAASARSVDKFCNMITVYTQAGKFVREFGGSGTGDGQFDCPGSIAVARDGKVYVADQTNRRVQVFDPAGKFLFKWGTYGTKPGEFGGGVSKPSRVGGPQFVAFDSRGHVFTTEGSPGRVQEFTADGKFVSTWGDNEDKPGSFGGAFGGFKASIKGAIGIHIDTKDRIWVSAVSGRVQQFSRDGKLLQGLGDKQGGGPGEFLAPHAMAVDSKGALYVADLYNHRIQKFAPVSRDATAERDNLERHELMYFLDKEGKKRKVQSRDDWELRRKDILAGMQKVMGDFPPASRRVPLDVKQLEEVKVGQLVRRKITFESEPGQRVPAYLFLPPMKETRKRAAVLCLHQTTRIGKGEPAGLGPNASMHYALHLAERGFITLAPDYPTFGDHKWDPKGDHGYVSGTMKAIHDNTRAVDLLQSLKEVDGQRIGVIGHSLGGHNALFTASFEPRLKVIVSSCGFCSFFKDDMPSWTGPVYMPRIASVFKNDARKMPFDFTEIVGLMAPRPFLACAALHDDDFAVAGVKDCMTAARPVYELLGKTSDLVGYYPDCKHAFPDDARKVAYEFLEKHLNHRP